MDAVIKGLQLDRAQEAMGCHDCETTQTEGYTNIRPSLHAQASGYTLTHRHICPDGRFFVTGAAQYHIYVPMECVNPHTTHMGQPHRLHYAIVFTITAQHIPSGTLN